MGRQTTSEVALSSEMYLLIFLRAVREEDPFGLHVAVENFLQRGHVTLDHIFNLGEKEQQVGRSRREKVPILRRRLGRGRRRQSWNAASPSISPPQIPGVEGGMGVVVETAVIAAKGTIMMEGPAKG